jgi:hypothetical protein
MRNEEEMTKTKYEKLAVTWFTGTEALFKLDAPFHGTSSTSWFHGMQSTGGSHYTRVKRSCGEVQ